MPAEKKFFVGINLNGSELTNAALDSSLNAISNLDLDDFASSAITSDLLTSALTTQLATAAAIDLVLPHYGKMDVVAATTGSITLPVGATVVDCFALEGTPIQRIEIGWSVAGSILTWETGVAIDATIVVQWVFNFVTLT